ncbi:MAG: agmatine deiminase [Alphaproteobacteria bacterium]|nr:agmatine deiminase [Alphaproteobacteria bacterium]
MHRLDADDPCPARDGFAMPAEWAPHERTLMCWPTRVAPWGGPEGLLAAKVAYGEVARTIARFEPVTMCMRPEDRSEAQLALGPSIDLNPIGIDDSWARDSGPSILIGPGGRRAGVAWQFNAWGNKYIPYRADAAFAGALVEQMGLPLYRAPLVCEGGAIHVDGEGTLMTTEQCLLNENRNPELTRQQVEERLALYCGVLRVIWLGEGFADTETDGHVDEIAAFVAPGRVIVGVHDDKSHPNYAPCLEAVRRLSEARDGRGRSIEVFEVKQPRARKRHDGSLLEASYVNFYLCNGAVIAPAFGDPQDDAAGDLLAALFPERDIVQIDVRAIAEGGGGLHCITQQVPKGT